MNSKEEELLKNFIDFWQRKGMVLCKRNENNNRLEPSFYEGGTGNVQQMIDDFADDQLMRNSQSMAEYYKKSKKRK
jgi:hypothetical protein